jgi:hypothetical protein
LARLNVNIISQVRWPLSGGANRALTWRMSILRTNATDSVQVAGGIPRSAIRSENEGHGLGNRILHSLFRLGRGARLPDVPESVPVGIQLGGIVSLPHAVLGLDDMAEVTVAVCNGANVIGLAPDRPADQPWKRLSNFHASIFPG